MNKTQTTTATLYEGNALEMLKQLPDNSVDLVLNDPPYGLTKIKHRHKNGQTYNQWDTVLDMNEMFAQLKRVMKPGARGLMFSAGSFTYDVLKAIDITPNLNYSQSAYWVKPHQQKPFGLGALYASKSMVNSVEQITIFNKRNTVNLTPNNHPTARQYVIDLVKYIGKTRAQIRKEISPRLTAKRGLEHFLGGEHSQLSSVQSTDP